MSQNQSDSRSRYEHQAYDVTYAGKSKETGAFGYNSRMKATYEANFQAELDVSADGTVEMVIPAYVSLHSIAVPMAGTGGTAPLVDVNVSDLDGSNVINFGVDVDPTVVAGPAAGSAIVPAASNERKVTFAITSDGASGTAVFVLQGIIVDNGWK